MVGSLFGTVWLGLCLVLYGWVFVWYCMVGSLFGTVWLGLCLVLYGWVFPVLPPIPPHLTKISSKGSSVLENVHKNDMDLLETLLSSKCLASVPLIEQVVNHLTNHQTKVGILRTEEVGYTVDRERWIYCGQRKLDIL